MQKCKSKETVDTINLERSAMVRSIISLCMLATLLFTCGCAPLFIGAAAGTGVFSYVEGELTRTYEKDYTQVRDATLQSLAYLKITVDGKRVDDGKTLIKAHQNDGTLVTVGIRTTDDGRGEVGVRCGTIGFWKRKNAELIHATILNTLR